MIIDSPIPYVKWFIRQSQGRHGRIRVNDILSEIDASFLGIDGKSDVPKNKKLYNKLEGLATDMLSGKFNLIDITDGATFYHADYVQPSWAKTKTRTVEIEDHIFYRWK